MDDEFVHCLKDGLGKAGPRCKVPGLFPTQAAAWKNILWVELSASRPKQGLP